MAAWTISPAHRHRAPSPRKGKSLLAPAAGGGETPSCPSGACAEAPRGGTACGLCCTRVEGFSVRFGDRVLLKDVNLHFHCGQITTIVGPNGSGKSTLLKAILGEVEHDGRILFQGQAGRPGRKPVMGYVPQSLAIDPQAPLSVADLFRCASRRPLPFFSARGKAERERVEALLERTGAAHLASSRAGTLSGGELQRVLLALALDPEPDILLLDEPVSGIDRGGVELFYGLISALRRERDLAVIMVSHDIDLALEISDSLAFLDGRTVFQGKPGAIMEHPSFIAFAGSRLSPTAARGGQA